MKKIELEEGIYEVPDLLYDKFVKMGEIINELRSRDRSNIPNTHRMIGILAQSRSNPRFLQFIASKDAGTQDEIATQLMDVAANMWFDMGAKAKPKPEIHGNNINLN